MAEGGLPPIPEVARSPFTRNLRVLAGRLDLIAERRSFKPRSWGAWLRTCADEIDEHESALARENVELRRRAL